jgi:hypothetical protein
MNRRLYVGGDVSFNGRGYFASGLTVAAGTVSFPTSSIQASAITGLNSFSGTVVMTDLSLSGNINIYSGFIRQF